MSAVVPGDGCVLRTARKPWTCVAGGCAIAPRDRYLEYLGEAHAYSSGSRYCLPCAQAAGLARISDPVADALAFLPERLRQLVDGAPGSLIVEESWGGPTDDELAICKAIVRLRHLARNAEPPAT